MEVVAVRHLLLAIARQCGDSVVVRDGLDLRAALPEHVRRRTSGTRNALNGGRLI
jgi:hypothetical protein